MLTVKLDGLSRIRLPIKYTKPLGWDVGTDLTLTKLPDGILISRTDEVFSCNKCNKYYSSEFNFCPNCGNKLVRVVENEEV